MFAIPEQSSKASGNWSKLLLDKVVIVTGGGGGIGTAVAHTCVLHGAYVAVLDINKTTADETVAKIIQEDETKKDHVIALEVDVSNEQLVENAVKTVVDKWKTIDILFNNAGILIKGSIDDISAESWIHIMNVNILGYVLMAKAVVPYLKKQKSGSIIQTSSVCASVALPLAITLSTTKAAVLQMTRNLALDLGPFNIRCNSICPGTIVTPGSIKFANELNLTMEQFAEKSTAMQCIKRLGTAQEIANLVVFLASDLCSFITGASFTADGGYSTI